VFYFLLVLESLLLSLPLPMLTVYLLHCCGENLPSSKLLHAVLGLWALSFILFVSAPFIDGFIYITPENQYSCGPLYPLPLVPIVAVSLLNLAGTIKRRKQLSRKAFLAFLIAILPIAAALTVHLFVDVYPLIDISFILSALAMYSFILSDQIEQDLRNQREIAQQQREIARQQRDIAHERASVMVLQMRPHFIYNTLMSIHSLCSLDPRKAQQITEDFTNYLRRNFNAVASDSAVPFTTELEHTRAYLAVEQAQYDDRLVVEYDTSFLYFRLPPLTLQPIVENAVKHGMDPYSGPLRISVRTRHTDSGTEIIVEDNGRGFDPSDESGPHTALANIRQRLEMMCSGSLAITPGEGGGTVVTVTIPDSAAQ
jgi:sensor histidine kinase YesM